MKVLRHHPFARLVEEIATVRAHRAHKLILSCGGIMVHHKEVAVKIWRPFREIMAGFDTTLFRAQRDHPPAA